MNRGNSSRQTASRHLPGRVVLRRETGAPAWAIAARDGSSVTGRQMRARLGHHTTTGPIASAPRPASRFGATRRWARAAGALVLGGSLLAPLVTAAPASADFATGGAGLYKGDIDWFVWGANNEAIPPAGLTKTNTRTISGQVLATTCTLGPITGGGLRAYRSGNFGGDSFDELYNIGGTNGANTLVAGLAGDAGTTVSFSLSCAVTLNGTPVPLGGLVMAEAEQSASGEFVSATIPTGGTWRIIDRYRTPGCTESSLGVLDAAGTTLKLAGTSPLCASGPSAVAFMDGVSSANVQVKGGGRSAIALGVLLGTDFGDAPASYGDAAALLAPTFSGGTLTPGTTTNVNDPAFALATLSPPALRLGPTVTAEGSSIPSPTASSDTGDDAITPPAPAAVTKGSTYTIPNVACSGGGFVRGWIDWNRNGAFDPGEASGSVACTASPVTLSWTVPNDSVTSVGTTPTFLRLLTGPTQASVAAPTGVQTAGEVEDYAFQASLPAPNLGNDTPVTGINTPITFNPLANDTGTSGATLVPTSVVLLDGGGNPVPTLTNVDGTYTVDPATGAITFTPATGFTGTAAPVTYRVTDSNGTTGTATVTPTVSNNSAAVPDAITIAGGTPTTFNPLANDVPPGGGTLDPTSVRLIDSGGNLTTSLSNADGTYSVNTTNGQITFTPSVSFTGPSTPVTYRVTDSLGTTRSAPITVSVQAVGIPLVSGPIGAGAALLALGGVVAVRRRRRSPA